MYRLWSLKNKNILLAVLRMKDMRRKDRRESIEKSLCSTGYISSITPSWFNYLPSTANEYPKHLPSGLKPTTGLPYWAIFKDDGKVNVQLRLYLLQQGSEFHLPLATQQFVGIILGRSHDLTRDSNIFILVVQNWRDHFEQIGHMILGRDHQKVPSLSIDMTQTTLPWELCFRRKERRQIRLR